MALPGLAVPSHTSFERNLAAKASSGAFAEVPPLLRPGVAWDSTSALEWLRDALLPLLEISPGCGTVQMDEHDHPNPDVLRSEIERLRA